MAERYVPEIGQAVWGNPTQEFAVPDIWDAALRMLRDEMDNVFGGYTDFPWDSPFGNTGARFQCDVFKVDAYGWGLGDKDPEMHDDAQTWNFKWQDVEISWYKHSQRGLSANIELTPDRAAEMLADCLVAVERERVRVRGERGIEF